MYVLGFFYLRFVLLFYLSQQNSVKFDFDRYDLLEVMVLSLFVL